MSAVSYLKYNHLIFCGFIFLFFPIIVFATAGIKTDFALYPIPSSAPVFSGAGSVVIDPTFGTSIMKVTDENDGISCGVNYSYYGSFNKDSTWLMALCSENVSTWSEPVAVFYKWDATNFRILQKIVKRFSDTPHALDLGQGIWSGTDPNVLYVLRSYGYLYAYNVLTNQATLIKDFNTLFPGEYQWQFHRSINDDLFSFTRKNKSNYSTVGYAVWRRSTDEIIYSEDISNMDEVQLDKTGNFLVVKLGNFVNPEAKIVNLITGAVTLINDGAPDFNLGHSDNGTGIQVGEENWNGKIWKYSLSNPSQKTDLLGQVMWPWNTGGGHYSMLADDESWVLASSNSGSSILGRELYLLATDGSLRIKRIAHHHSTSGSYSTSPRPNISRDGKFVAFTSNWENSGGRMDLYVVSTYEIIPPDTTPPIVSSISSTVTTSSASITWVTDELSDTQVEYGLTSLYGSASSVTITPTLSHSVSIYSLTPNTVYHYRVKSRDASGNISISEDKTFTTEAVAEIYTPPESTPPVSPASPPLMIFDTTAPTTPTNIIVSTTSSSSINLIWDMSTDAVGVVGYKIYRNGIHVDTSLSNSYSRGGLNPSSVYSFTVSAYDAAGNTSPQSVLVSATTLPSSANHPVTTVSSSAGVLLTKNLSRGMQDPQIYLLQEFLKKVGFLPASTQTSTFFGPITEAAVKQYQASKGIDQTGIVGSLTRGRLAEGGLTPVSISSESQNLPTTLSIGMEHPDVVKLQNILKKFGFFPVGVASSGRFGPTTKKAVQLFQRTYNLVSGGTENTTGYGMVGKKTWAKLLSL